MLFKFRARKDVEGHRVAFIYDISRPLPPKQVFFMHHENISLQYLLMCMRAHVCVCACVMSEGQNSNITSKMVWQMFIQHPTFILGVVMTNESEYIAISKRRGGGFHDLRNSQ